ncbi:four helix bundle protein [Marivirga tractuosa]|uniref:S23 ribosomal protein n=1 Tax=Marivirga tractuosa (strain ATCC 23168 / DSM 4126 / NBRC 15989 / NCIMB 1408 / VKM B-1430 / H-43) TaxID=643867 RepID=E4TQX3_MARTH|nr:four helix bundle protein [Marivirga tractuosa]ADR21673.1 S23 ribosomal protein [Marivirga tractuosa DSM 4126]
MHNYKKLKIWEKSMELSLLVYQITSTFPKEERFGLISQIRRCAVSIPSNIAEGSSRDSSKDFSRFLRISIGSSFELETQLLLSKKLEFISHDDFDNLEITLNEVQKMLNSFIKKLNVEV